MHTPDTPPALDSAQTPRPTKMDAFDLMLIGLGLTLTCAQVMDMSEDDFILAGCFFGLIIGNVLAACGGYRYHLVKTLEQK